MEMCAEYSAWLHVVLHALTLGMPSDAARTERNCSSVVTIGDVTCSAAADHLRLGMCRTLHAEPDLLPTNRASRSLVKFVFGEEDEHEEALYGTANHRVSEGSRGRYP